MKKKLVISNCYRLLQNKIALYKAPKVHNKKLPNNVQNIAIVRFGRHGDHLLSSPLVDTLLNQYPKATVELITHDINRIPPWQKSNSRIKCFNLNFDPGKWPKQFSKNSSLKQLRHQWDVSNPDIIIIANDLIHRPYITFAAYIAQIAPSAWITAMVSNASPSLPFLHVPVNTEPAGLLEIKKVLKLAEACAANGEFFLPKTPYQWKTKESRPKTIIIHSGGSSDNRRWPEKNFVSIASYFINHYKAKIILIGSNGENKIFETGQLLNDPQITNLTGKTDAISLVKILSEASLFIGNDSYPMHLAIATGTPTVGLIGPGSADYYSYDIDHFTAIRENIECSPNDGQECPLYKGCTHMSCFTQINIDSVIKQADKYLN